MKTRLPVCRMSDDSCVCRMHESIDDATESILSVHLFVHGVLYINCS